MLATFFTFVPREISFALDAVALAGTAVAIYVCRHSKAPREVSAPQHEDERELVGARD